MPGFESGIIELSSPIRRASLPGGGILHFASHLDPIDVTRKHGIPVTTVIRTMVDLGSVVKRQTLEGALDYVLHKRMTSIQQLRKHLQRLGGRGRAGAGVLRDVLDDREKMPTESELERSFLKLVKKARIPLPESQVRIALPEGSYRLDFVWESHVLIVETEGYEPHSDPKIWERDRPRRNALTLAGWRVLHFTWQQVMFHPVLVIETLRKALGIQSLPA